MTVWMPGFVADWTCGRLAFRPICFVAVCLSGYSVGRVTVFLPDWLAVWLADWLTGFVGISRVFVRRASPVAL